MHSARVLARSLVILLASQVTGSVLTLALTLSLPIYLGVEGLGRFAFAQSTCLIVATVAVMGTDAYLVRAVAEDRRRLGGILSASLAVRLAMWAIVTAGLAAVLATRRGESQTLWVTLALACTQAVAVVNSGLAAALQGLERMGVRSVAAVASSATGLAIGLPAVIITRQPLPLAAALCAGQLVSLAILLTYYLARLRLPLPLPTRASLLALAAGAAPFTLITVVQGVYAQAPIIVTGTLAGPAPVAWYASVDRFSPAIILLALVVMSALTPTMTRLHAGEQHGEKEAAFRHLLGLLMVAIVPVAAVIAVIGPRVYADVYPAAFRPALPLLPVMALSWTFTAIAMALASGLISVGRQRRWAAVSVPMLFVFFAFSAAGVLLGGQLLGNAALGAATGTLAAEAVMVGLGLRLLPPGLVDSPTLARIARVLVAGALATGAMLATAAVPVGVSLAAGAVTYVATSLLLRAVTVGEIREAVALLRPGRVPEPEPAAAA